VSWYLYALPSSANHNLLRKMIKHRGFRGEAQEWLQVLVKDPGTQTVKVKLKPDLLRSYKRILMKNRKRERMVLPVSIYSKKNSN